MLDAFPLVLSVDQAEAIYKAGHLHLLACAELRCPSSVVVGNMNKALWQLLPKHHYMLHVIRTMRVSRVNCRHFTLLCGESFIGAIGRVARLTHRSSVPQGTKSH